MTAEEYGICVFIEKRSDLSVLDMIFPIEIVPQGTYSILDIPNPFISTTIGTYVLREILS